ncbi:RICIN domain-containing protein [Streptomyces sp. D2-8]|uniref:RICIN domain-containing protein n=1 Tax=Streptomyces sp. D2-8 TaxID=2707767 RepID=UPI0027E49601|nr:RICIN domain-containing protein [Streptomyces sp. D2-8]
MPLEIQSLSRADGGTVGVWGDADAPPQQHWAVTPTGDGHYLLINRYSGLALAVDEGSTANGAGIEQQPYTSQTHQQ